MTSDNMGMQDQPTNIYIYIYIYIYESFDNLHFKNLYISLKQTIGDFQHT